MTTQYTPGPHWIIDGKDGGATLIFDENSSDDREAIKVYGIHQEQLALSIVALLNAPRMPGPELNASTAKQGSQAVTDSVEVLSDDDCDKLAAQAMDRLAASKPQPFHALDLNANITEHHSLRRALIRAGFESEVRIGRGT